LICINDRLGRVARGALADLRRGGERVIRVWYSRGMDREMLKTHLQEAVAHIARAEERVAKQRRFIAMLEQDGQDTAEARELLAQFEGTRVTLIAYRDRLVHQLGE
jgi:hypothetical protein